MYMEGKSEEVGCSSSRHHCHTLGLLHGPMEIFQLPHPFPGELGKILTHIKRPGIILSIFVHLLCVSSRNLLV